MTTIPTSPIAGAGKASPFLRASEWMAENAYIAPGFHRLLTAGGLTLGLWGGRRFMDVVTARSASNGEEIAPPQVPEIVRPLHGIMRYNSYSDNAADRWKFVLDRMAPMAFGAFGAYWGGKLFFHGKIPGGEAFSVATETAKKAWESGNRSTSVTDSILRTIQSDAIRKPAAATFIEGSAAGQHLFGALWPINNGTIALSFQKGAGRNIYTPFPRLNRLFGNYGATSRTLTNALSDTSIWMERNITKFKTAEEWVQPEALLRRAKDCLQHFPERTAEQEQHIVQAFCKLIDDGYALKTQNTHLPESKLSQKIYNFVSGKDNPTYGLSGEAFEHFLVKNGMDHHKIKLAADPISRFALLIPGTKQKMAAHIKEYAESLNTKFGYQLDDAWVKQQLHIEPWKMTAAYGGGAAAIGVGLWGAHTAVDHLHRKSNRDHHGHAHESTPLHQYHSAEADRDAEKHQHEKAHGGNIVDWVNGRPLDVAHWLARVVITPPSMHRFMNAAYLSGVLYGGMKFANILTGRKLTKLTSSKFITNAAGELVHESVVAAKDVWAPFRPLHGLLEYTPGSAEIRDRWRQAVHYIIPVGMGMFGTYTGSYLYFKDRIKALEHPHTLEDYADRIAFEQSKFYAGATALTSIFNTGSGIHLLPVFNYSSNLHNRYLMGSGQQVAMPGLGKWWSGNAGTTPWGVKRSLGFMTKYLTNNPAARPRELPSLVHSVLGKLYPTLTEEELLDKKQLVLDRIYDVRDSYLVETTIPASKQAALGEAMHKLLSGEGFEAVLRSTGLDPAKADLASNGMSGKIANLFGQKKDTIRLAEEYRQDFAERAAKEGQRSPQDYLRTLLDKGPAANDASFAERAKTQQRSEKVALA